jgi:hypothetical protein
VAIRNADESYLVYFGIFFHGIFIFTGSLVI